MLAQAGQKLGAKIYILSPNASDPAAVCSSFHTRGALSDSGKIQKWAEKLDVVTYESEFVDPKVLKLKQALPRPKIMGLMRDRKSQKETLSKYKIPMAPTMAIDQYVKPLVFKKRLFGYDGYGTRIVKSEKAFNEVIKELGEKSSEWIAEEFVPFKRELALSFARNKRGEICQFPLVETHQKEARCFWVKGPMENKKLSLLQKKIKGFLDSENYIGLITFELFETKSGELIVNEVAPRVHNSGHYSIEASSISQFEAHLLSICNVSLPKKSTPKSSFAMVNLLGRSNRKPSLFYSDKCSLHWYGKTENRTGRKMGHLTVLSRFPSQALEIGLSIERKQKI